MRKFYSTLFLLLFSILLLFIPEQVTAQNDSPYIMKPIGAEAFEVMRDFFNYDKTIPLEARIVESQDNPEYVREKIVFRGVRDSRVPGYLAIPKNGTQPYPCVLQLHGGGRSKSDWWDPKIVGLYKLNRQLLSSGFAVMSLDAQYHGERIHNNDFETILIFLFQKEWEYRYRDMMVQSTVEYRRAIDYLNTRNEIDITRIGIIGYSMGGMMTFQLTGVEPRIRASVACVTPTKKHTYPVEPQNFAQRINNRPFLMLMGRTDPAYTIEEAEHLFDLVDSPTKELVFYDSGHTLPDDFILKTVEWFQRHLK